MGLLNIFKAVAGKKITDVKETLTKGKREAIDTSLPLQIHLGSALTLDQTPFLIHGEAISQRAPQAQCIVFAYGRIDLGESVVHRFYLEGSDNTEHKSVLQIVTDQKEAIEECRLFETMDEVYPESKEDWDFWMADEDGYIGLATFEDKKERSFDRVWGDEDERSAPVAFTETLYLTSSGDHAASVSHAAMLYGRWIDEASDMAEYVLISREEHTDGSALIQISSGIDLIPESISVQY